MRRIAEEAAETAIWTGRRSFAPRVIAALAGVPREMFVPADAVSLAYDNRPLAIGFGQTISQPFIVAVMSDLLDLEPTDRVLEIGTGSGYQTAILARLAHHVFSVEAVSQLATQAASRLACLGCANVSIRHGDGYAGWPDQSPFDAIIVTAAPMEIPGELVRQLAVGGRLVIPVGATGETQYLFRCIQREGGTLEQECKLPVAFVPMVRAR